MSQIRNFISSIFHLKWENQLPYFNLFLSNMIVKEILRWLKTLFKLLKSRNSPSVSGYVPYCCFLCFYYFNIFFRFCIFICTPVCLSWFFSNRFQIVTHFPQLHFYIVHKVLFFSFKYFLSIKLPFSKLKNITFCLV